MQCMCMPWQGLSAYSEIIVGMYICSIEHVLALDRDESRLEARGCQASWLQPVGIWLELRHTAWDHWTQRALQHWRPSLQTSLRCGGFVISQKED